MAEGGLLVKIGLNMPFLAMQAITYATAVPKRAVIGNR
jgi:hypothetical protein